MFGQDDQNDDISTVNPTLDSGSTPAVPSPTTDTPPADAPTPIADTPVPEVATETPAPVPEPAVAPSVEPTPTTATDETSTHDAPASLEDTELLSLKEQAIKELAPLLDQLDQSPEEKFKTTMMMIQATDNADLVKGAHEAASKITDEKIRAQALLDIVNEINYFTQPKD